MFYRNEMRLLCDTFRKGNVQASVIQRSDPAVKLIGESMFPFVDNNAFNGATVGELLGEISPRVIYKANESIGLSYIYFELPETDGEYILCIGPYVYNKPYSPQKILELAEKNGIPPQKHKIFEEYMSNMPIISETSPLFLMLEVFGERIWDGEQFSFSEIGREHQIPIFSPQSIEDERDDNDLQMTMKIIEKRYDYENKLIKAVSLGQTQRA